MNNPRAKGVPGQEQVMELKPITFKQPAWFEPHEYAKDYPLVDGPPMWAMAKHMRDTVGFCKNFPIVLRCNREGVLEVLDGRTRQMACKREKIQPHFVEFIGTDLEALEFVTAANLHRRHLGEGDRQLVDKRSTGRRALLAGAAATATAGTPTISNGHALPFSADSGNSANLHGLPKKSLDEAANEQGVSRRTAADGKKVVQGGTEALQNAVIDGTISVSDAAKIVEQPTQIQDAAVWDVKAGKASTAAKAVKKRAKPKPKNGQPLFHWPDFKAAFGRVVRHVNDLNNAHGLPVTNPGKDGLLRLLDEFLQEFKAWAEKVTKQKVPSK
jgi:hypothetical protein